MEDSNDTWSLIAVVRECTTRTRNKSVPISPPTPTPTPTPNPYPNTYPNPYPYPYQTFEPVSELVDMYKPFLASGSSSKSDTACDDQMLLQQQQQRKQITMGSCCPVGIHRKKKFEERRVCRMKLDELSEDKWAWRKYGQKPIKGSPYPRNYYRCSSSKGCTARKQVERSPIDPNTYLVTYTGHHHHARPPLRNSSGPRVKLSPTPPADPKVDEDEDEEVDLIPNSELLVGMERLMTMEEETVQNGYGYDSMRC